MTEPETNTTPSIDPADHRAVSQYVASQITAEAAESAAPSKEEAQPSPVASEELPPPEAALPTETVENEQPEPAEEMIPKGEYTRKTQQLAEKERRLEAERLQERQQIEQLKAQYQQSIAQALKISASGQDPVIQEWIDLGPEGRQKMAREDPYSFTAKKAAFEERSAQLTYMHQQKQDHDTQQLQSTIQTEMKKLVEKIPEWADQKKAATESNEVKSYLLKEGFADSEVNSVMDHRALSIARKAYLYDRMLAEQKAAAKGLETKRLAPVPSKALKPGTGQTNAPPGPKNKALMDQARKSGRDADIVAAILANL